MTSWVFPPSTDDDDPRSPIDVLSVTVAMQDQLTVVELHGPACAFTAPYLDRELTAIEDAGRHRLVVDVHGVRPLCAAGLDVLVDHAERCHELGGELLVRDPNPGAHRVLTVCELQGLLGPGVPVDA